MDVTELRIGNFVHNNVESFQIQAKDLIFLLAFDNEHYASPIPLTEEWLLKFDFERKEEEGSEYWTIQIGNNLNLTISLSDYTAGIDLEWRSQGSQIWMMVDAVNKLQNVFYYLSGEELKIKD